MTVPNASMAAVEGDLGSSPQETAAKRIERAIRKAIVTLELKPGTSLSEKELAERYGVSRQPVREAFISLARAEFVEIHHRRGTFVVKISAEKMRQARFVRESLEVAVARAAATCFDAAVRDKIEHVLVAQETLSDSGAHYQFQRADENFHRLLAEGAGFPVAWDVIDDIKAHMDRVCHLTLPTSTPLLVRQHRAIIAAIDAHDPQAAEVAMHQHLEEILRALPDIEAQFADLFA
ncbi:MAG: GntR family transcriptional regulator [Ancalomicrobiaceae bacterium]|nr:GntR family transcriptional regulator [Ancalomicrobiaceae bacterium]